MVIKHSFLLVFSLFFLNVIKAQVIIFPIGIIGATIMPEHGFLPGKKFKYYSTIDKYNFNGLKIRIELYDERKNLLLTKIQCSETLLTNTSEFTSTNSIYKLGNYLDTLFKQAGVIIDTNSTDILKIKLEAIDARLIGFGYIRVHGLCQIKINYRNINKTYCIDITDADKNSPISPNAFVTRLTATRIMASAAMREVIEQFFADIKEIK